MVPNTLRLLIEYSNYPITNQRNIDYHKKCIPKNKQKKIKKKIAKNSKKKIEVNKMATHYFKFVEDSLKALDENGVIESIDIYFSGSVAKININKLYSCYNIGDNKMGIKYNNMTLYDEKYGLDYFHALSDDATANFINNYKYKIKELLMQIIG